MSSPSLYADLSQYYDLLCSSIDYSEQCEFALRAHQVFGNGNKTCLDLACGSGALLQHLARAGLTCTGVDLNQAMLAIAGQRCPEATFLKQNMTELALAKPVDLITCFLYSLHYCHPLNSLLNTLQKVHTHLNVGGLFCFDTVDKNSIANDAGHKHQWQNKQRIIEFQSRWFFSGEGDQLDLHIDICDRDGPKQCHYQEHHLMCAIDIATLQSALLTVGFAVQLFERDFQRLLPWQGKNGNLLVCATKL